MRLARYSILLWVCALASGPAASCQQRGEALRVGDRVRVSSESLGLEGYITRVDALGPDTLFLASAGDAGSISVPLQAIDRLEVSRGWPSRRTSTGTAAVIGLALGISVAALQAANCPSDASSCYVVEFAAPPLGLLLGGIVGWLKTPEQWELQIGTASPIGAYPPA